MTKKQKPKEKPVKGGVQTMDGDPVPPNPTKPPPPPKD